MNTSITMNRTTQARSLRYIAIALLSALLASCAAGPDFKRPDPPATSGYTATQPAVGTESLDGVSQKFQPGATLASEWWRLFQSDALNSTVASALEHNRTLSAAAWSLAQAQELANARAGAL